jgi:hypothetical protein
VYVGGGNMKKYPFFVLAFIFMLAYNYFVIFNNSIIKSFVSTIVFSLLMFLFEKIEIGGGLQVRCLFQDLFQDIMFIPLVVVIFEQEGFTNYMTYSPMEFHDGKNYRIQMNNLLKRVQEDIVRDRQVEVKGVYVKHLETPLEARKHMCYFSTYKHLIGDHKPLHKDSPIFFELGEEENDYVISQPNLVHTVSKHAFV